MSRNLKPRILLFHQGEGSVELADRIGERLKTEFGFDRVLTQSEIMSSPDSLSIELHDTLILILGREARFLEDSHPVLLAIEIALTKGINLIPVLTDGAKMPRGDAFPSAISPLAYRHALGPRMDSNFDSKFERLIVNIRHPAIPSDSTSPANWFKTALSRSFRKMIVYGGLNMLLHAGLVALIVISPKSMTPNTAIGLICAFPAILGLIVGGQHGILGAISGLFVGPLLTGLQLMGWVMIGVVIAGAVNLSLGQDFTTLTTDHWIMILLASGPLSISGILLGASLSIQRGPFEKEEAYKQKMLLYPSLMVGLILGIIMGEAAYRMDSSHAGILVIFCPTSMLVGIELALLSASLTGRTQRKISVK